MKRLQLLLPLLGLFFLPTVTSASVLDEPNPTNTRLVAGPTITQCPSNLTLNVGSSCDAVVPNMLATFQATDNCATPTTLTYAQSPIAGTVLSGHGTTQNVVFTATDNCGQSSNCTAIITLRDVRAPEILAHNKVVELARGQATITINDVLNVVQDNCTPSNLITLQLSRTTFTCVDLISSPVSVKLTATDAAGNVNFVNTSITVQDNMNDCTIVPLTGKIKTESGVGISNVQVVLKHLGTPITTLTTDATGNYSLNVVATKDFTLEMTKNTNISNGVTVADANAISNHIANTPALSSPYKVLAANVTEDDGSGSAVGFTDLTDPILVQQLATGVITTLPVQSWIFVPANHVFNTPSPANAFPSPLPIRPLLINIATATVFDVIGIKKGDVNGDADPNQ